MLADDVIALLKRSIHSIGQVEVLLLLFRRREGWSAEAVSRELRSSPYGAETHLKSLQGDGLVEKRVTDGLYYFSPASPAIEDAVGKLAILHSERMTTLVELIYDSRPDAIRAFAEAFRIKKKDPKDG